jgi:hypothetical protein
MSLTVFMALCILGLDFVIYVVFHRIYGDKRSAVARQVAAFKEQSSNHSGVNKRPFMGTRSRPIEGSAEKRTVKRTHAASFDGRLPTASTASDLRNVDDP